VHRFPGFGLGAPGGKDKWLALGMGASSRFFGSLRLGGGLLLRF
jgi:hypothetical protein